jgi:hypothetical protein
LICGEGWKSFTKSQKMMIIMPFFKIFVFIERRLLKKESYFLNWQQKMVPVYTNQNIIKMKKTLFIGLAVLGLAAMTSCKKQYTCNCAGSSEFADYSGVVTIEAKKKDAAAACAAESGPVIGGVNAVCVLAE